MEVAFGPCFSVMNFPTKLNEQYVRAGLRTCYAPTEVDDYKYADGFRLKSPCKLYSQTGEILSEYEQGTRVWFTIPPKLYSHKEINAIPGTYARVNFDGNLTESKGFVALTKVEKPAGKLQGRVNHGKIAQEKVFDWVSREFRAELVSIAKPGSQAPDLIVNIEDHPIQFEIKGTASSGAPITLFDKSVNRTKSPKIFDQAADLIVPGSDFVGLVDFYRSEDSTIGFAGDEGVCKSGKMPLQFTNITDCDILAKIRTIILEHFHESSDDYFVVYNRNVEDFSCYHTGASINILNKDAMPDLKSFSLRTYGGPNGVSTRVGVKIKL